MRIGFVWLIIITFLYALVIGWQNDGLIKKIDWDNLVGQYFLSQDITHEVNGKRLFLSDGEIHLAAGYLYLHGYSPAVINFQHPPLLKYLYGYVSRWGYNPLWAQVGLGYLLVMLTFYIGVKVFNQHFISLIATILLMLDPLFRSMTSEALLDLGQSVLIMLYFIVLLIWKKNYWLSGLVLGLLLGAKFWGSSIFFISLFGLYLILAKEFKWKNYLMHMLVAMISLFFIYLPAFIYQEGKFNLVWFQLKLLKYWLNHSVATRWGSSVWLFLTGYVKSWWGNHDSIRVNNWSVIWPILLVINLTGIWQLKKWRQPSLIHLIMIIPVGYLLYLSIQAPFIRYYSLILPFLYLGVSKVILDFLNKLFVKSLK